MVRFGELTLIIRTQDYASRNLDKASRSLSRLSAATPQAIAAQRMHEQGRAIASAGRAMQLYGAGATLAFGAASNAFANFSQQTALAGTQMRNIGAPMQQAVARSKELQDSILNLSMRFPASASDMANAAYNIYSSMNLVHNGVVDVAGGLKLLEVANKAAVAGGVDLNEATTAMIVTLNNFDPSLRNVSGTMDTLFNIVRYGYLHFDDLAKAMAPLAPIASSSGQSLKSLGGAFATLTTLMQPPQRAATGLARLMEMFRTPSFAKGFEAMGISVRDSTGRMRPLLDIFQQIAKLRPDLTASQTAAIEFFMQVSKASGLTKAGREGLAQSRRVFEELITHMGQFAEISRNVARNKGELDAAFAARMQDPGVQWAIFMNQLKAFVLVVGREAIPVFLMLGEHIRHFINWFRNLSGSTRGMVIRFAAFGSIALILGGILTTLLGTIMSIRGNMALMSIASKQAGNNVGFMAGRFALLRTIIGGIAFVGISILLTQVVGLKKAVIIMTTAWLVWRSKAIQSIVFVTAAAVAGAATIGEAFRAALTSTGWGALAVVAGLAMMYIMDHWNQTQAAFLAVMDVIGAGWQRLMQFIVGASAVAVSQIGSWLDKLSDSWFGWVSGLKLSVSFMKVIGQLTGESTKSLGAQGRALIKSSGFWDFYHQHLKKTGKGGKDTTKSLLAQADALAKKFTSADFRNAWDQWANSVGDANKKASELAKAHARAVNDALQKERDTVKQATKNLMNTYNQLYQQNQQALGGLFQGPTMQGILGQVFGNINDVLRQFGVQIPVPFSILRKDLTQQLAYFKRWRGDLNKLLARGAPPEFVQMLQQMGPEQGISIAEGLLQGGKSGFRSLMKQWRTGQRLLEDATKRDLNNTLKIWNSYGKQAGWEMIMGLIDRPQQLKIEGIYRNYIKTTYGDILRDQLNKDIAQAMADARRNMAAQNITGPGAPKPPGAPGTTTTGRGRGPRLTDMQRATRALRTARMHSQAYYDWATNPDSPGGRNFTRAEMAHYQMLSTTEMRAQRHVRALQRARARHRELVSIAQQLEAHRRGVGPHRGVTQVTVTYGGDSVTVKADGATPASVLKALNRHKFRRRQKGHAH